MRSRRLLGCRVIPYRRAGCRVRGLRTAAVLVLGVATGAAPARTQMAQEAGGESAEAAVRRLYELVTVEAGETPDWAAVRSLFLDEAVIVLRTSRDASTVFSLDGFVADFQAFIERADVEKTGFSETILRMRSTAFGDIAHVWVLYEANIPGSERTPQQGVDGFQLIRTDGRWRIVSVVNEIPMDERPIPKELMSPAEGQAYEP